MGFGGFSLATLENLQILLPKLRRLAYIEEISFATAADRGDGSDHRTKGIQPQPKDRIGIE
jgi:hypothetical protein